MKNENLILYKKERLLKRSIDSDTTILSQDFIDFEKFIGLMELWTWEKIMASSIVLLSEDVGAMSKDEQIEFVFKKMNTVRDPKVTYQISGDHIFINFGFSTSE